jgi:hypothetical protein
MAGRRAGPPTRLPRKPGRRSFEIRGRGRAYHPLVGPAPRARVHKRTDARTDRPRRSGCSRTPCPSGRNRACADSLMLPKSRPRRSARPCRRFRFRPFPASLSIPVAAVSSRPSFSRRCPASRQRRVQARSTKSKAHWGQVLGTHQPRGLRGRSEHQAMKRASFLALCEALSRTRTGGRLLRCEYRRGCRAEWTARVRVGLGPAGVSAVSLGSVG